MLCADRKMIVGMLFLIPVMVCFTGVGAFLHIVARAAADQEKQAGEPVQKKIGEDSEKANELNEGIRKVERQIEEIRKRLAEANEADDRQAELARLRALKEQLQDELSSLETKLDELEKRLGKRGKDCDDLRRQVAETRRKLEELKQKLAEMVPSDKGAKDNPREQGPSLAALTGAIAELQRALEQQTRKNEQAQAEWDGLRQERQNDPRIKIEEIRGSVDWRPPPNPLYVECDGQGVALQPENVRLPARPGQAERDRFARLARQRRYVLFLIRPDGFDSFHTYRPLVVKDKVDYGYEPINQQGRVLYPDRR